MVFPVVRRFFRQLQLEFTRRFPMTRARALVWAFVLGGVFIGLASCSLAVSGFSVTSDGQTGALGLSGISFSTASGPHAYRMEWAVTDAEQEKGLMYRRDMAPDAGMVFDFHDDGMRYFWMKNTYLSLDMIFVSSDGLVRRILRSAKPMSEDVLSSGEPVRYVIEVNAGQADAMGLKPGDRVTLQPPAS